MSDKRLVAIAPEQFGQLIDQLAQLNTNVVAVSNAVWGVKDQLGALIDSNEANTADISKWLAEIANRISNPGPPQPQLRGTIMAKFRVSATNPDIEVELTGSGFTDEEGNPTGAGDIDLSVESSNPDAVAASITEQTLSDDGQSVSAKVAVHFGAPASDIAVLTYRATNRDTGAVVAAGTDEFAVEVGEATLGSVSSTVPLPPEA